MSTPLKSARTIQQRILSSKEGIRNLLSYNAYRKDDSICSDKELEAKLKMIDREMANLLRYVEGLESQARREARKQQLEESQTNRKKKA
jgi:hypothetical protein